MSKAILQHSEYTEDGKPVVNGVYYLVGSHGVPLELVLMFFKQEGFVVNWVNYIDHALKDGANVCSIRSKIEAAVSDVYGKNYCAEVLKRMDMMYHE